jgi:hypothetical protein
MDTSVDRNQRTVVDGDARDNRGAPRRSNGNSLSRRVENRDVLEGPESLEPEI